MDRLLFGDNQFFGVNHMSEEKARAQSMRFQDTRAIMDVLDREMVGLLHATNALLGEDEYCMDYITAFREGLIGPKKD